MQGALGYQLPQQRRDAIESNSEKIKNKFVSKSGHLVQAIIMNTKKQLYIDGQFSASY